MRLWLTLLSCDFPLPTFPHPPETLSLEEYYATLLQFYDAPNVEMTCHLDSIVSERRKSYHMKL